MNGAEGVLVGVALTVAVLLVVRAPAGLARRRRGWRAAGPTALHALIVALPQLRLGLSPATAVAVAPHLREIVGAPTLALTDGEVVLAIDGPGEQQHHAGDPVATLVDGHGIHRVRRVPHTPCDRPGCPLTELIVAPLLAGERSVGRLVVGFGPGARVGAEDTRIVSDAASLVSALLELHELDQQHEQLARAELRALRAQISPHFVYNALAAVASFIHTNPDEARELLIEFAEFTRYAFREQRPYVTVADELRYVEKYLRLEQARFGDRLDVRIAVDPDVLQAEVPVLSIQPLVENAVRHGIEPTSAGVRIEILGRRIGDDVELTVRDDGPGMIPSQAQAALAGQTGGIGLANVQTRIRQSFGTDYGLGIASTAGGGTTVRMRLPRFPSGVRP